MAEADEPLLLDLLNSTPVLDGVPLDELADADAGRRWLSAHRQPVSEDEWRALLDVPEGRYAAVRAVLTWDVLRVTAPGRLRPCANSECRLFLIDHSKPNTARWCSMAICGNRMKARRHYQRTRRSAAD